MTSRDEAVVEKVRHWMMLADDDLRVAEHTLGMTDACPYRLVAFHAQQCAEKYLKAYLVFLGVDFPFTHNIARLVELVSEHTDWGRALQDAEELTPFAITARYPGVDDPVDESEARRAVKIAAEVQGTIGAALRKSGVV
jgi:HEPN domain-containing protein